VPSTDLARPTRQVLAWRLEQHRRVTPADLVELAGTLCGVHA
jgi:hypothetical protein